MPIKIMILNGPNLNFLGIREPHIYGSTTLGEIEASCQELAKYLDVSITFHQSNLEGELVNLILFFFFFFFLCISFVSYVLLKRRFAMKFPISLLGKKVTRNDAETSE